ncbi:MAG: sulfotransferase [Chthonomonadales bacterium]|nr:sulfotransferase [Chthonomonadales bacterium]
MAAENPFARRLRRSVAYESFRWCLRQLAREHHYPPPLLERVLYTPFSAVEKHLYATGTLSTAGLALPDFLGLGAMKSGTTWLWGQLSRHPDIFMPEVKEVHYLSWSFHRSLKHYSTYLEPGRGKRIGDITVDYGGIRTRRIRFLKKIMPDLKLVYMMRNPIDRAWSHAKQELMFRTHRSFEDVREWEFVRRVRLRNNRHYTMYLRDIDNWTSVYGPDSLYVGVFDEIKRCPERLLTDVLRHLGVNADLPMETFPLRERFMEGVPSPPMPRGVRRVLEEMYAQDIEALHRRFGDRVEGWRVQ